MNAPLIRTKLSYATDRQPPKPLFDKVHTEWQINSMPSTLLLCYCFLLQISYNRNFLFSFAYFARQLWFCYYVFSLKVAQEIDARTAKIDSLPRTCATFDRCVCDVSLKYVLHKAQGKKGQPFPTE